MKRAAAPERAKREWMRRIEAEYRSAAVTQHLTLWLIQIGEVIGELVRRARRQRSAAPMAAEVEREQAPGLGQLLGQPIEAVAVIEPAVEHHHAGARTGPFANIQREAGGIDAVGNEHQCLHHCNAVVG